MPVALGLDWSGAQNPGRKIWAARVALEGSRAALLDLGRPFLTCASPRDLAACFGGWLAAQDFDVAGLDFCFGLHADHMQALGLPLSGPAPAGAAILVRFEDPAAFKAAVGPELRRETDRRCRAPFAPTNWRMYRQTFWGMAALAGVTDPIPPWDPPGPRSVIEVLPALMARRLCPRTPYKHRDGGGRRQLVAALESRLDIGPDHCDKLLADHQGDALDAVLAAVTAGLVLAAGFPAGAVDPGEGWIYTIP